MALQRCIFLTNKQYISQSCMLLSSLKPMCSKLYQRYISSERRYSERHEWVSVEEDSDIGTVGISDYAQESLGDIVFAQLPERGKKVFAGSEVGSLESVKAASDIYSPVSGSVVEKNMAVENMPPLINTSCYEKGWLFKIQLSDPGEVNMLMNEDQYKKFLIMDNDTGYK